MAASQVGLDEITIVGQPKWFYVNEQSRHGFCPECGSQLFWRNDKNDFMSITGGSMDNAELPNRGHIFTSEKGAYYDIPNDEIQCSTWSNETNTPASES